MNILFKIEGVKNLADLKSLPDKGVKLFLFGETHGFLDDIGIQKEILEIIKMKTEVCIPITAETAEEAIKDMKQAEKLADLVELRIDFIKNIDENKLKKLLKSKKKKIIVTCRPKSLCGNFDGNE